MLRTSVLSVMLVERLFGYLVFNNVLKTLAQTLFNISETFYLDIYLTFFSECSENIQK